MKSLSVTALVTVSLLPLHVSAPSAATRLKSAPAVCASAPTPFELVAKINPADITEPKLQADLELHRVIYGAHFSKDWDNRLSHFTRLNRTGRMYLIHDLAGDMIEAANWTGVIKLANEHAPGLNRSLIYRRATLAAGRAGVAPDEFIDIASPELLRLSNIDYWYSLGVGLKQGSDAAKSAAGMFSKPSPMLEVFLLGITGDVDGFVPHVERHKGQDRISQAAYSYGDIGPAFLMGTLVARNRAAFNKFITIELPGTKKTAIENAFRFLRRNDPNHTIRKQILKTIDHSKVLSEHIERQIKLGVFMNDIDVMLDLIQELDIPVKQEAWLMIYLALLEKGNEQSRILSLIKYNPAHLFRDSDVKQYYGLDTTLMAQMILPRVKNESQFEALTQILNVTDLPFDQKKKLLNSARRFVKKDQVSVRPELLRHGLQKQNLDWREKFRLAQLIERVCYGVLQKKRYFP